MAGFTTNLRRITAVVGVLGAGITALDYYSERQIIWRRAQCVYSDQVVPRIGSDPLNWYRQCSKTDDRPMPADAVYTITPGEVRDAALYRQATRSYDEYLRRVHGLSGRPERGEIEGEALDGEEVRWMLRVARVQVADRVLLVGLPLDREIEARVPGAPVELSVRFPAGYAGAVEPLQPGDTVEVIGRFDWNTPLQHGFVDGRKLGRLAGER